MSEEAAAPGREGLPAALLADMEAKGIDVALSLSILEDCNAGLYDSAKSVRAAGVPAVDGRAVVSLLDRASVRCSLPAREARDRLGELGLAVPKSAEEAPRGELAFGAAALEEIGLGLAGRTAFGVLNGGSATSYADSKKNLAFGKEVFDALEGPFRLLAPLCEGEPKGLTPAYLEPDLSPGSSFLLLKMRARLLAARLAKARGEAIGDSFMPLFQMSSVSNDARLAEAYAAYEDHPFLSTLSREARPRRSALGDGGSADDLGLHPLLGRQAQADLRPRPRPPGLGPRPARRPWPVLPHPRPGPALAP